MEIYSYINIGTSAIMKKDYIFTLLTQAIVLISFLLTYKLIAIKYGDNGFSTFSFLKRDITFLIAFLGLGLYTALIKYISTEKKQSINLLKSSFIFSVLFLFLFYVLMIIVDIKSSHLITYYNIDVQIILPSFITLAGMYLHNIIYAYYRGMILIFKVNLYEILSKAIAPFISILFSNNLIDFFFIHGIYQIFIAVVTYMLINKNHLFISIHLFLLNIKKLISYGIRRIGSDLGLNILLILPIVMISNNSTVGFIAFLITLLSVTGYFMSPLGNVLLPRVSNLLHQKKFKSTKELIIKINIITIITSLSLQSILYIFKYEILSFFIENISPDMLIAFNYMVLSILPFIVFIIGRNIIDSYYKQGINSINIISSIVIYIISYYSIEYFALTTEKSVLALLMSLIYLGISTGISILNMLKRIA